MPLVLCSRCLRLLKLTIVATLWPGWCRQRPELKVMWIQYRGQAQRNHPWMFLSLWDSKNSKKMGPTVVNSSEFKQYTSTLNSAHKLPSSTTLSQKLIPEEAHKNSPRHDWVLKNLLQLYNIIWWRKNEETKRFVYHSHNNHQQVLFLCWNGWCFAAKSHNKLCVWNSGKSESYFTFVCALKLTSSCIWKTWSGLAHLDSLECAQTTQEIQGKDWDLQSPSGPKIWTYWTHAIYSQIPGRIYVVFPNSKRSVICIQWVIFALLGSSLLQKCDQSWHS